MKIYYKYNCFIQIWIWNLGNPWLHKLVWLLQILAPAGRNEGAASQKTEKPGSSSLQNEGA